MNLLSAEWLILFPLLFIAHWQWPDLELLRPLRFVIMSLFILILTDPTIRLKSDALDLWVLIDRSASVDNVLAPHRREWETLLREAKGKNDRIFFVDFADIATVRGEGDESHFHRPPEESRVALAIRFVLSKLEAGRMNRMLLLSDGYSTESLNGLGGTLVERTIPLDYRFITLEGLADTRVDQLVVPTQVLANEPFLIQIEARSTSAGSVPYKLARNGVEIANGQISIEHGRGVARVSDSIAKDNGAALYRATLYPSNDSFPGNNESQQWVSVSESQTLLLLSRFENNPLIEPLRRHDLEVRQIRDPSMLDLGMLNGARAIIFQDIAAHEIPHEFLKGLDFYVRHQGGGLIMIGGKNSFGSGGYFNSPIDPLLPVSMELREEHKKIASAFAIALDRSGSMAAAVEGNMGGMQKMDLADEGAARSVELMGPKDGVAILAVDSAAHSVVPFQMVGNDQGDIARKARSIRSAGGGIFVYEALRAAWDELESAKSLQKHIILFADAADAEEPGEYKELLKKITAKETTVSVIGLGSTGDSDAELLKDVAERGQGRVFFVANAVDLPAVFAQETVSLARSTFVTDPTTAKGSPAWSTIAAAPLSWPARIDGYNLSYLRPEASSALNTTDDYQAPLLAFWQRGAGRTAAVTFPMTGNYSNSIREWPAYQDFIATLARWVEGPATPPGAEIRTTRSGSSLIIEFFYERDWEDLVDSQGAHFYVSKGDEVREVSWEKVAPGHFQAVQELQPQQTLRGVIKVGKHSMALGPVTLGQSAEFEFERSMRESIKQIALESGGQERIDLATIWDAPRNLSDYSLRKALLWTFLVLFLLEALLSRLGVRRIRLVIPRLSIGEWSPWRTIESWTQAAKQSKPAKPVIESKSERNEPERPAQKPPSLKEALEKAKRRGL